MQQQLILPDVRQLNAIKSRLMKLLGNLAIRHFQKSFEMQMFNGDASEPWKEVQRREKTDDGKFKYKYKSKADKTNPILIGKGSGNLKKSFAITEITGDMVKVETIGTAEAYAAVHNEGLRSGRGSGFTMPKRQFAGESDLLDRKIEAEISKELDKFFS